MAAILIRNLLLLALVAVAWVYVLELARGAAKPLLMQTTAELHRTDYRCISTRPLDLYPPERQRNTHMSRDKGVA